MNSNIAQKSKIKILGTMMPGFQEILTDDAMDFLTQIQEKFGDRIVNVWRAPQKSGSCPCAPLPPKFLSKLRLFRDQ